LKAHRDAVREATIKATAALVAQHGLTGVTMSQIAKDTGIGRATLYKYFPDVESILRALARTPDRPASGAPAPESATRPTTRGPAVGGARGLRGGDLAPELPRQ